MAIRVLIAEDHAIVRKGLVSILEGEQDIEVIGEASDGREAVKLASELKPDLVVMDISMPSLNGLDAARQIIKAKEDVRVLMLSMHQSDAYVFEVLRAGVSGYVVKHESPDELIKAIRTVYAGKIYLSPGVAGTVVKEYLEHAQANRKDDKSQLTAREREILQLIAEGNSNRKISETLFVSVKTVEAHRAHILDKLKLHSTADLTRYAIRSGIIEA